MNLDPLYKTVQDYEAFFLEDAGHVVTVVMLILVMLAWVGSASLASSLAEARLRGHFVHFVAGLVFPLIWPAVVFALGRRRTPAGSSQRSEPTAVSTSQTDVAPPVAKHMTPGKQSGSLDDHHDDTLATQSAAYGMTYFKRVAFDEAGHPGGPFSLVVEGVQLRVERIVDVAPEHVAVETVNADGKQQTLRVPYSNIESCREL